MIFNSVHAQEFKMVHEPETGSLTMPSSCMSSSYGKAAVKANIQSMAAHSNFVCG